MEPWSGATRNCGFEISFKHAGKIARAHVTLDWFQMRIPDTGQVLWGIVGASDYFPDPLVLITNRPVRTALEAQQVYRDWMRRPTIEHLYRFIQEDGLDVEEIQVQTLERQRVHVCVSLGGCCVRLASPWDVECGNDRVVARARQQCGRDEDGSQRFLRLAHRLAECFQYGRAFLGN